MNVFISGGCKNGKSFYAQRLARRQADEAGSPLYYIATMIPHDEEEHARIRRHLSERDGWGFTTLECGKNLLSLLDDPQVDPSGVFLAAVFRIYGDFRGGFLSGKSGHAVCCFYYIAGTFCLHHHQPDTDAYQPVSRAVITLL